MTKHTSQKQGLAAAAFSLQSIKGVAFLWLVILIVVLIGACHFLERTTEIKRLVRPQKKKFYPRRIDEYFSSLNDKKINELLIAKHHQPIHPN